MPQSIPYQLSQAVFLALQGAPDLAGATFIDNPTSPADLNDGERVVFIEDKGDDRRSQEGQAEARTFTLTVGTISRTEDARAGADADMELAKAILVQSAFDIGRSLVAAKKMTGFSAPREGKRGYRVEGLDIGGALVWTDFEIDYRMPARR